MHKQCCSCHNSMLHAAACALCSGWAGWAGLRCAGLRCAVLRCAVLCCAALRCAALCCAVLCCAVPYRAVPGHATPFELCYAMLPQAMPERQRKSKRGRERTVAQFHAVYAVHEPCWGPAQKAYWCPCHRLQFAHSCSNLTPAVSL